MEIGKNSVAIACLIALAVIIPISQAQNSKKDFLIAHNIARAQVGVGPLRWSKNLTARASSHVEPLKGVCQLAFVDDGYHYGYNLAAIDLVDFAAIDAVKLWVDKKAYYNYKTNSCVGGEQDCKTYTQVVWRNSLHLGCAKVRCDNGGTLVGCAYDPPGNVAGQLFICFIFPVNAALPSILGNDLIEKTCNQTPYYELCIRSLISNPHSFNTDVQGLAKIMVHTINARATHTLRRINKLLQHKHETNVKQAIRSCAYRYYAIIKEDIPQSLQALRLGEYKFAEGGTMDAAFEAESCEKEFMKCQSPLADMNRVVHDVSIVAASIVKTIIKG
ncbi:unnamed protein product [Dovyalis caffra]|uniref:SCP domain-containing protein n=1 Tax=Dovyalis caffra TaxID=77055 RepID=A0AAV1RAT2_9ROSI|nr:unnamed protein product [Dovyalis caffra]